MSFEEKITALAQRAKLMVENLQTEESTKNALVMPFIAALGYDVFNPLEVIPEFTADVGIKKGEKVDYAIAENGDIIMLFECKWSGANLSEANMSQLFRYFTVTHARIAILTNGVQYRFYSDLEEPNKMDARPFLELDLFDLQDEHVAEVKKLSKGNFNLEEMLDAATELKYTREIRQILHKQFEEPDEEFVRFFYTRAVPGGRFIASVREQFTAFVRTATNQYISDRVNKRLQSALRQESAPAASGALIEQEPSNLDGETTAEDSGVVTTEEELEGYHIIKAIVREVVDTHRIAHRDTKSYMGILLDNNNRKPICRLRFNYSVKYIGLIDADKNETRVPLEDLDDIYKYADQLKQTVLSYS